MLKRWCRSLVVNPGTKETVIPPSDIQIHVKGLSLGAELKDKDGRSSLKLSYEFVSPPEDDDDDDEEKEDDGEARLVTREVILGSLTPGKVNHVFPCLSGDIISLSLFFRLNRLPWTSFWTTRTNTSSKWWGKSCDIFFRIEYRVLTWLRDCSPVHIYGNYISTFHPVVLRRSGTYTLCRG
jgi:hypothetical protein